MMNKFIEQQLNNVKLADISNYDRSANTYHIPKYNELRLEVGKCYLLELDNSLIRFDSNSMLISNWNRGTYPKHKYLKVDVIKQLGKMVFVNSIGYDNEHEKDINDVWEGWLPLQQVSLVKEI